METSKAFERLLADASRAETSLHDAMLQMQKFVGVQSINNKEWFALKDLHERFDQLQELFGEIHTMMQSVIGECSIRPTIISETIVPIYMRTRPVTTIKRKRSPEKGQQQSVRKTYTKKHKDKSLNISESRRTQDVSGEHCLMSDEALDQIPETTSTLTIKTGFQHKNASDLPPLIETLEENLNILLLPYHVKQEPPGEDDHQAEDPLDISSMNQSCSNSLFTISAELQSNTIPPFNLKEESSIIEEPNDDCSTGSITISQEAMLSFDVKQEPLDQVMNQDGTLNLSELSEYLEEKSLEIQSTSSQRKEPQILTTTEQDIGSGCPSMIMISPSGIDQGLQINHTNTCELSTTKTSPKVENSECTLSDSDAKSTETPNKHRIDVITLERVFDNQIFTLFILNTNPRADCVAFLESVYPELCKTLKKTPNSGCMFKVNARLDATFERYTDSNIEVKSRSSTTAPSTLNKLLDMRDWFDANIFHPLLADMGEFSEYSSGWTLRRIDRLLVFGSVYSPLAGSACNRITEWKNNKCILNFKSKDTKSFQWAVLAGIFDTHYKFTHIKAYKKYVDTLNFEGIQWPVATSGYTKFEKQNNVSINVFTICKQRGNSDTPYALVPIYMTIGKKAKHANLLLLHTDIEKSCLPDLSNDNCAVSKQFEYCTIISLSRLLDIRKTYMNYGSFFICDSCLGKFRYKPDSFVEHLAQCRPIAMSIVKMPTFSTDDMPFHVNHSVKPFIVYIGTTSELVSDRNGIEKESLTGIGYFFCSRITGTRSFYKSHRGTNCLSQFCEGLKFITDRIHMHMAATVAPVINFKSKSTQECFICGHNIDDWAKASHGVLHCHFTGKFLGHVHVKCNTTYLESNRELVVVFHKMSMNIFKQLLVGVNQCIIGPSKIEKSGDRMLFTKRVTRQNNAERGPTQIRFMDSAWWLEAPFDKLVSMIPQTNLHKLRQHLLIPNKITLQQLYTNLDRYDLCLKTNVLQLADVFEHFRNVCRQHFDIDAAHYGDIAELSWNAMVKHTGVQLKLLTEIDQLRFIERGMRGGISHCSYRYAKANDPDMGDQYNPEAPNEYLMHLRAQDLYGRAMMQCLPVSGFTWIDGNCIDFTKIPDDSSDGYILEVDLDYPTNLNDSHFDLPFCAERQAPRGGKTTNLILSLENRTNYVLHYRMLKAALKNGLVLRKVHRCLQFQQSPFLKPFVDMNLKIESQAYIEFDKFIARLLIKSLFAKFNENPQQQTNVSFHKQVTGSMFCNPFFESRIVFDSLNVAFEMRRPCLTFRSPIIVGMALQDISKCLMYDFHYDFMKRQDYIESTRLLYIDTDTVIYRVRSQLMYELLLSNIHLHQIDETLGGFRSSISTQKIFEFVGIRAKMFSLRLQGDESETPRTRDGEGLAFEDFTHFLKTSALKLQRVKTYRRIPNVIL